MESTLKPEILYRLKKIESAVQRLITQNEKVETVNDYYCTPWGMERLESSCMLLIAVGESIKGIDKDSNKQLLPHYIPKLIGKEPWAYEISSLTTILTLTVTRYLMSSNPIYRHC